MRVCLCECVSERAYACVTVGGGAEQALELSSKYVKRSGDIEGQGLGDTGLE